MRYRLLLYRIRKKPFYAIAFVLVCLILTSFFHFDYFSVFDSEAIYQGLDFQNALSRMITPAEIFSSKVKQKSNGAELITSSLYKKLANTELSQLNWRFSNAFENSKIEGTSNYIDMYKEMRQKKHIYDPRITLSVYLDMIKSQIKENSCEIPFSWEDWVDLSPLNAFLEEGTDVNCLQFLSSNSINLDYDYKSSDLSSKHLKISHCLDKSEYLLTENAKYRNEKLLPGFNFDQRIDEKSDFIGKVYNGKSYLLSYAPVPSYIYFWGDNGKYYRVKPYQSTSMMGNGMFESFRERSTYDGFDPVSVMSSLSDEYFIKNVNSFSEVLSSSGDSLLNIQEDKFIFDPQVQYKDLFSKADDELSEQDIKFKNSLQYSMDIDPNSIDKHFKEVNIKFPTTYRGHKLTENGGHYDARFFSGFITEMPESEATFHSPEYIIKGKDAKKNEVDSPISRRTIILSHLLHTVLTAAFHNGLLMFPAHGSLLGWYFTSTSFPWDSDGDVQMPISDLVEFCHLFNNSMIVQNPRYGTAKVFIDCSSTLTHRGKENGSNNIDARVVDVDSGLFVDITGLSVSGESLTSAELKKLRRWVPNELLDTYPTNKRTTRKKNHWNPKAPKNLHKEEKPEEVIIDKIVEAEIFEIHKENHIYNCRNKHFYTLQQLSPLRLTLFEGAPTFVAANKESLRAQLITEYSSKSVERDAWEQYVFSKPLRMWLNADDIYQACQSILDTESSNLFSKGKFKPNNIKGSRVLKAYHKEEANIIATMIQNSAYQITKDPPLKIDEPKPLRLNLIEYLYYSRNYTSIHAKEMDMYYPGWEWSYPGVNDYANIPSSKKDLLNFMLEDHPPAKMSLFDYLVFAETEGELDI